MRQCASPDIVRVEDWNATKKQENAQRRARQSGGLPVAAISTRISVIGDRITKHFDYALGCEIESRSQERRLDRERGLVRNTVSEHRQRYGGMEKPVPIISYPGQTTRSGRKSGVRIKTGEQVI